VEQLSAGHENHYPHRSPITAVFVGPEYDSTNQTLHVDEVFAAI
jgi:hypothetical protein